MFLSSTSASQSEQNAGSTTSAQPPVVHEYVNFSAGTPNPAGSSGSSRNLPEEAGGPANLDEQTTPNTDAARQERSEGESPGANTSVQQNNESSATLPSTATLDEDTDSASGEPYDELYSPTVRPHKRSQVLERIVFEDGVLQLTEREHRYEAVAAAQSQSPLRVRRRAYVVVDELDTWYRLPTTTPEMRIDSVHSEAAVEMRRMESGIYELRIPTSPAALNGPVAVTLHTTESRHYAGPAPQGLRLAAPPDYRTLPAELLREVGTVLRSIPTITTTHEARGAALAALTEHFRSFRSVPLSSEDDTQSLFYRTVTQQAGVCRHRAFGFVMLAQALGIRARYVANELHAFAEVQFEDGRWFRVDLGGLNEPGSEQVEQTPASPSATPPVRSAQRAGQDVQASEDAEPDSERSETHRVEINWIVDRQTAYRGDALVFSGNVAEGTGTVSLWMRSPIDEREVHHSGVTDDDGRWSIAVTMDSHWSVGSVDVTAYFEPDAE